MEAGALISELKRRRVIRALVGYGIAAFAVLQIIEPVMHGLHWPDEVLSYVVVALAVGFPIVVSLAWIFDVNAGRIERTGPTPTGALKGIRLGLVLVGIGVLAAAPGTIWYFFVRGPARPVPSSAAEAAMPSIAVLPFADMSPSKDQEYFSDGMAEELLNLLAKVPSLHVAGRTSAFAFKGKSEDLRTIGQRLNVANVLEGSVRKSGDQIRITTQLISTSDGYHLWSETYDRKLTDVFAVQDEIARAVVAALKLKLLPAQAPTMHDRRTANPEVYNQYLLGLQLYNRGDAADGLRGAIQAFERALTLDPNYAPAWAGLAIATLSASGLLGGTAAKIVAAQERALAAAEKAVALDPDLPDGYVARGRARVWARWDWAGGRADFEHALALNPSDAVALRYYADDLLSPLGRLPEAIAAARKATELDPLNTSSWMILGLRLSSSGRLDAAREALGRALAISPENDWAGINLGIVELLEGQPEQALARFARLSTEWGRLTGVALAEHDLGHAQQAQDALEKLISGHAEDSAYQLAQVYSRRGDNGRAIEWLERACAQRDPGLLNLKDDPLLSNLRGDPRWRALLKKMNLPL